MQASFQLGKNGLTDGFIELLKNAFKTHDLIKVSLLKTSTRERAEAEKIAQKICEGLGNHYTSSILGFTILIKKWRKIPVSNRTAKKQ